MAPDQELVEANLGNVGKADVKFSDGHLVAEVQGAKAVIGGAVQIEADVKVKLGARAIIAAIKAAIPGHFEDALLDAAADKLDPLPVANA